MFDTILPTRAVLRAAPAGVSALTLCGLVLVAGVVVTRSVQLLQADPDPWRDVRAVNTNWHFLYALPIVVFAFQSHTNVRALAGPALHTLWARQARCTGVHTPWFGDHCCITGAPAIAPQLPQ